jgi:hypothetical protein
MTGNEQTPVVSHEQMRDAQRAGHAVPLSKLITDIVRYRDHWWIGSAAGWILVDDPLLIQKLDDHRAWTEQQLLAP